MAGIIHLSDIYSKKGKEFLENLFSSSLVVTEKADGSAIFFQKTDNELLFFKRDDRKPLSRLDRTLMKFYEKPISYLSKFSNEKMPSNYRFGFEYFQNTQPVSIAYERLPKNNLVLTHIKIVDVSGKTINVIDDEKELSKWAKIFDVEGPYIIFNGKLDNKQKDSIYDFLNTPFDELVRRFRTDSFTRYIVSILNPSLKNTALSYGIENPIEGLVFKFKNADFLAKVVDPVFTDAAKTKAKERIERTENNDQYAIIMSSFISWLNSNNLVNNIVVDGSDKDEKYIDLVTKLTVYYINDNTKFLSGVEIEVPDFAKQDEFRLNLDMINNKDINKFIRANQNYEPIFRMFLSGFKQLRVKKTNLIDDNLKRNINAVVTLLNNRVQTINENFLSFDEWLKLQKNI